MKCSIDPKIELGHNVSAEIRRIDNEPNCVAYWHPCKNGEIKEDCVPLMPFWSDSWNLISENPLTLSPSLLCRACGHHGFIQNGKWVPA